MAHRATASSRSSCRATAALRTSSREATSLVAISAILNCRYYGKRGEENHRAAGSQQHLIWGLCKISNEAPFLSDLQPQSLLPPAEKMLCLKFSPLH